MFNFAIVDDDSGYRKELEKVILFQADWKCVISASSATEFKQKIRTRLHIDFALVDINLPDQCGIELLPLIGNICPEAHIIMLTQLEDREALFKSLSKGADGYLLKGFSPFQFPQYIKIYKEGGALISPLMARYLVEYFNHPVSSKQELENLSAKEARVLNLLAEGNSYEEIAKIIGCGLNTVRFHIKNIYKKLKIDNRIDAARIWNER